jgi:hypothetical protein
VNIHVLSIASQYKRGVDLKYYWRNTLHSK